MYRLSSLLAVSCALLSTFALPYICSPSSSCTSFVAAAPSHALLRDATRLTDQLNRILLEINSVLDSEDQNEDDEEQEELDDEQEIEQSAAEDPVEDLPEGQEIIGTINEADAPWWPLGKQKTRKSNSVSPEQELDLHRASLDKKRSDLDRQRRIYDGKLAAHEDRKQATGLKKFYYGLSNGRNERKLSARNKRLIDKESDLKGHIKSFQDLKRANIMQQHANIVQQQSYESPPPKLPKVIRPKDHIEPIDHIESIPFDSPR